MIFAFGMKDQNKDEFYRKKSEAYHKRVEVESFDLYESIRPKVEEFVNEWFIVGIRPGCGSRILIGSRHKDKGWNTLQEAYDAVKEWKEKNPLGDFK